MTTDNFEEMIENLIIDFDSFINEHKKKLKTIDCIKNDLDGYKISDLNRALVYIKQEEYEKAVTAELADYECETIEEFEEQIGKDDYIYSMLYEKVADFLLEQSQKQ